MSTEAFVAAIGAIASPAAIAEPSLAPQALAGAAGVHAPGSFGALVSSGLEQVSQDLAVGQTELQQLAAGEPVNLHQVMIHLEESRLSFELLMQVRNRLLEGYQEVMRLQV